jgi:type IV pilus assembly protein PilX
MTITSKHLSPLSRQSGAALITGLIFLVVLTMIGITAARMSTLEERMSGNMRDRSIAMQAAEMALRDAEQDITNAVTASARGISGITGFTADCGLSTGITDDDGLCYSGAGGVATVVIGNNDFVGTIAVSTYGDHTGANPIDINGIPLPQQPRYVIEGFEKYCWTQCEAVMTPGYRITVRAQGVNPNTVVWLQAVYKP